MADNELDWDSATPEDQAASNAVNTPHYQVGTTCQKLKSMLIYCIWGVFINIVMVKLYVKPLPLKHSIRAPRFD